jgi:hypothetical protein
MFQKLWRKEKNHNRISQIFKMFTSEVFDLQLKKKNSEN